MINKESWTYWLGLLSLWAPEASVTKMSVHHTKTSQMDLGQNRHTIVSTSLKDVTDGTWSETAYYSLYI